LNDLPFQGPLS